MFLSEPASASCDFSFSTHQPFVDAVLPLSEVGDGYSGLEQFLKEDHSGAGFAFYNSDKGTDLTTLIEQGRRER